jgi:predicted dehydrogenase/threonine dehydrogenase-like Zn-dependent dehydrogenase
MKQLQQNMREGTTTVSEVPIPAPQNGQALVHTAASLVSAGTERMVVEFAGKSLLGKARSRPDLARQVLEKARREGLLTTIEAAFNRLDQPMPLGYSSAGTITALGEGMQGFQVGQRVACAGGGYAVHAEYATVPRMLLTPLPEDIDFESAAFTTLGAIALHGFRLAEANLGERVAVIGLGLLGLLTVGIARAAGCHVLGIDLDPWRVALAIDMGAEAVIRDQAEAAAQVYSRGRGCDAILICADTASADPVELAGAIARDRARVIATGAVGLEIPRKTYFEKELTFLNSRSYGPGRYDPTYEEAGVDYPIGYVRWTEGRNLEAFVDLLAGGHLDVKPLITHRFPIDEAPQAYELITGKTKESFLGILLTYPQDDKTGTEKIKVTDEGYFKSISTDQITPTYGSTSDLSQTISRQETSVALGVLGAGNFARAVMLPVLSKLPGIELVAIASASGMNAQHSRDRFGFQNATSDENQVLADPAINTVAVLTRHHLHALQVLSAIAARKHIFCEKPLALTDQELNEIEAALYSSSETLLTVGFNRRFAPLARQLKTFIQESQEPLVAHYRINAGYIPLDHWTHDPQQGGGRIIGEGCHFIDFITFLVGAPPVTVSAQALPDAGRYREDNTLISLAFPDGSLGTIHYLANGDKAFPKERLEIFSGGRVAVLDDYRSLEMVVDGKRVTSRTRLRQDKGHSAEWQAFTNAILAGGPAPIPYDQIFGVMRATFAAVKALRSGGTVQITRG